MARTTPACCGVLKSAFADITISPTKSYVVFVWALFVSIGNRREGHIF